MRLELNYKERFVERSAKESKGFKLSKVKLNILSAKSEIEEKEVKNNCFN